MSNEKDIVWLIDDSQIIHKAIRLVLKGYEIHSFFSGEQFLDFLETRDYKYPDLIMLDILMEKISGYEVIERLMNSMEFREIPIIILSTRESIDDKVKGLEMGATDYIVKPFYEKELFARVRVHIKIKKNQDALREKVILDFLTNTFNKRHLFTRLKRHFNVYDRHKSPFSVVFFDIDHFKDINDQYGHLTGDFVLKELCSAIKTIIRSEDEFFRYGGEEFVIIAPFTTRANAAKLAEKVRQKIMDKVFVYQEEKIKVTLSLGIACVPDDNILDAVELLTLADKRMLTAKQNGRNRIVAE